MERDGFIFITGICGMPRKAVVSAIAGHFGTEASYKGAPGFEYVVPCSTGEWLLYKDNTVETPELDTAQLEEVLGIFDELKGLGADVQGCRASVVLPIAGHSGITLRNLVNIAVSKETLLKKALGMEKAIADAAFVEAINSKRLISVEEFAGVLDAFGHQACPGFGFNFLKGRIAFQWFNGSLDEDEIRAYIQLAQAVNRQALAQKHSTPRPTKGENEKYAFRVWLLRMGFIGSEYKASRKVLLNRLEGNSAFRAPGQASKYRQPAVDGTEIERLQAADM